MRVICRSLFALLLTGITLPSVTAQSLLGGQTDSNADEFLPVEKAFVISVHRTADNYFTVHWDIAPEYYLYRDKIEVAVNNKTLYVSKPPGRTIADPFFGNVAVYRKQIAVAFEADIAKTAEITWQGCADAGLCYPPVKEEFVLAELPLRDVSADMSVRVPVSEQQRLADYLDEAHLLLSALIFFGLGLLLAFTPCVLPMIPILSSLIISSHTGERSSKNAFVLSLVYVLAMALTYSVAGAVIALSGSGFQIWFQHPVVLTTFAMLFVVLAFGMFGFYNLQLPAALNTRLSRIGESRRGSLSGAAIMGAFSALIVSPCVTPPLIGALLFVARSGDVVTGGLALFSLALGMGAPLLVVGTSLERFMPKSTSSQNVIKFAGGFLMIAIAIWLLDRITAPYTTALLGGLLITTIGLIAIRLAGSHTLVRIIGAVVLIYGGLLSAHAINGGSNWLQPWRIGVDQTARADTHTALFPRISSLQEVRAIVQKNQADGKITTLIFYADWCVSCKELEVFTFSDEQVKNLLSQTDVWEVDVTKPGENSRELLSHFGLFGPPAILFFDKQGQEEKPLRTVGFINAKKFATHMNLVLNTLSG